MNQAQIQDENAVCIICREGIVNPICPECRAKEIKHWKPGMSKLMTRPAFKYTTEAKCISCGKNISICAHCYSRDIYDILMDEEPEAA